MEGCAVGQLRRLAGGVGLREEADLARGVAPLPPAVAIELVPLDYLDAVASAESDLVFVLGRKVV
jgi:hypothetical protein